MPKAGNYEAELKYGSQLMRTRGVLAVFAVPSYDLSTSSSSEVFLGSSFKSMQQ